MRCGGVRCEVCLTGEVLLGPVLGFVDLGNRAVKLVIMRTGSVQSLYGEVRRGEREGELTQNLLSTTAHTVT